MQCKRIWYARVIMQHVKKYLSDMGDVIESIFNVDLEQQIAVIML